MSVTKQVKQDLIKKYAQTDKDVGSIEVQCAILTERILNLTEHFKSHPKDSGSKRGMLAMVNRRKKFLSYLESESKDKYLKLINELGLRK